MAAPFHRTAIGVASQAMTWSRLIVSAASITVLAVGCAEKRDWGEIGYDDGYAVGYNTACEIRATMIEGNFDNKEYAEAYARGRVDGANGCYAERRATDGI